MAETNQNITVHSGDSKTIDLTIYNDTGDEVNLAAYDEVNYYVYEDPDNILFSKSLSSGVSIIGGGKCAVDIEPADTADNYGEYTHEVDLVDGTEVYTVMTGKLTILPSVNS